MSVAFACLLGADYEEKHEPVSDIDTAAADSLKALDPEQHVVSDAVETGFEAAGWISRRFIGPESSVPKRKKEAGLGRNSDTSPPCRSS
jgi:hypothetical protein